MWQSFFQKAGLTRTCQDNVKICGYFMFQVKYPSFEYDENYDIANAMIFLVLTLCWATALAGGIQIFNSVSLLWLGVLSSPSPKP